MAILSSLLMLCTSPALAGVVTLSGSGGLDYATANPWAGIEVAVHPTHSQSLAWTGRFAPTWGIKDNTPIFFGEVGPSWVIPEDEALVRIGVLARVAAFSAAYPLAIHPGGAPQVGGRNKFGLVPGAMATLEFEWGKQAPYTIGFKGGVGSAGIDESCAEGVDPTYCVEWVPAFIGGFYGRARLRNGLAFEIVAGPTASISIGYAFKVGSQ